MPTSLGRACEPARSRCPTPPWRQCLQLTESEGELSVEAQKSTFVTDMLGRRARLAPNRVALEDAATGRTLTYAEWEAQANRTANFLRFLGVQSGDRVAVYAANSIGYLDVWMACGKIGAILQNLNWRRRSSRGCSTMRPRACSSTPASS